ncbi:hypothetical protein M2275_006944 [Rhodococcus opacus]|nr:hypothetical protein [Rhodococcus opacus]
MSATYTRDVFSTLDGYGPAGIDPNTLEYRLTGG